VTSLSKSYRLPASFKRKCCRRCPQYRPELCSQDS